MKIHYLNSILILFIAILSFTAGINQVLSQDGEGGWTQLEPMSKPRFFGSACYLDGKIFASGGYDDSFVWMSHAEVYSISANEWTTLANMHQKRLGGTMETMNNKVYAIGGSHNYDPAFTNIEEYDPGTDTWTILGNTPERCWGHSSCVFNNKVYIMGGYNRMAWPKDSCFIFDPATNTWDSLSPMNYLRAFASSCIFYDKIYIFGGTQTFGPEGALYTAEVYDPSTDTWENIAHMPISMLSHIAIADEEKQLIILMYRNRMYAYHPLENKYTRLVDLPVYCYGASAVKNDRYIYLLGGEDSTPDIILSDVWRFNLDSLQAYVDPVSIDNQKAESSNFSLQQITPNPLVEYAEISYELAKRGKVKLEIYNCFGKLLAILIDKKQISGKYTVIWNAIDVAPGVYFCKLNVNGYGQILKLVKSQ